MQAVAEQPIVEWKRNAEVLKQRQALPLDLKIEMSLNRIRHWYEIHNGEVAVAFSGGKDSTVLLHLVRSMYPEVPAVFVDTGLEYPEIRDFVKSVENVTWLKPKQTFKEVIERHGWPVISKAVASAIRRLQSPGSSERTKHKALYGDERGSFQKLPEKWHYLREAPFKISERCCEVMKIRPMQKYHKDTCRAVYIGTMAADSNKRNMDYLKHGCFQPDKNPPKCIPMAFWFNEDVWTYIEQEHVEYCPIYDTGVLHTGCVFCAFGVTFEPQPNRFQRMAVTHPKLHTYCIDHLGLGHVLDYISTPYIPTPDQAAAICHYRGY